MVAMLILMLGGECLIKKLKLQFATHIIGGREKISKLEELGFLHFRIRNEKQEIYRVTLMKNELNPMIIRMKCKSESLGEL